MWKEQGDLPGIFFSCIVNGGRKGCCGEMHEFCYPALLAGWIRRRCFLHGCLGWGCVLLSGRIFYCTYTFLRAWSMTPQDVFWACMSVPVPT